MTGNVSPPDITIYHPSDPAPQGVWSLVASTFAMYRRFAREFLLASGSVFAALWIIIGISIAVGYDFRSVGDRTVGAVALWLGTFAVYYALVLLTIVAGQARYNQSISLAQAYRTSLVGLAVSVGALAGMALVMVALLIVPLVGLVAALYVYLRLSVGFEMATLERLNPIETVRRAWTLTRGRFLISLPHALLQHGYMLSLVMVLALLPHVAIAAVIAVAGLPLLPIARVLSYSDLQNRQRLDTVRSHDTIV